MISLNPVFCDSGNDPEPVTPSILYNGDHCQLLFDENLGFDDFRITKDVYPTVAKLLRRSSDSVSRSVERMTARLWRCGSPEQLRKITGQERLLPRPARETILYLAYYLRAERPISALRYGTDVPPNRDQRVMIASRSAPTET